MKLPSIITAKESSGRRHPWWKWAAVSIPCTLRPKTVSFRMGDDHNEFATAISHPKRQYFEAVAMPDRYCKYSEEQSGCGDGEDDSVERVIRGVRASTERLLFEPPGDAASSSILEKRRRGIFGLKRSVVLAMESEDPYGDFRRSMEEMVEWHGVDADHEWRSNLLEELLGWYLKMNGKKNHGLIFAAFLDLLVGNGMDSASVSDISSSCYSSALSSFASS